MTAGGPGVSGAIVYAFDATTSAYIGNTTTGAGGAYSITLAQGSYKLWIQTNTAGYPDQAYGPDGTFANATVITLSSSNQTINIALVAASTTRTISGNVTAGGPGVSGAIVYAFDATTSAYIGNTTTGAGGAYSITLAQGSYKLWIQTNTAGYPDQAYGPDGTFANATVITLSSSNQTINIALVAASTTRTISGNVTAGGPGVSGAIVYAFDATTSAYIGNTTTGAGGAYSITLAQGSYKLWIQTNTAGYPDQAYGPDGTFANATVITLSSSNQTINIALVAASTTRTISGNVTAGGPGVSGAIVYAFDATTSAYIGNTTTGAGGAYSITLAQGSYKLWIQTNTAGYPDQAYGPDGTFANATVITLSSSNQTINIALVASP